MSEFARREAKERAYTAILTVCFRLNDKRLLTRTNNGQTGVYEMAISREAYRAARAAAGVDALLEEAGDLALVQFARRFGELDADRRAALERLMYDE